MAKTESAESRKNSIPPSRFIEVMDSLQALAQNRDQVSLKEFFQTMGTEGHAVLLIFLCLPYLQPIPIPGLSTPFGVLIAVVAYLLYFKRPVFLPARFGHLKMSSALLLRITGKAERIWTRIHRRIYARWDFFFTQKSFRVLSFWTMAINGVLLALPLPIPFSNTVPAVAILLNALGQMESDGRYVIASYLWSLLCFGFFLALGWGALWGIAKF